MRRALLWKLPERLRRRSGSSRVVLCGFIRKQAVEDLIG
jgi:hypothetical protein